MADPFSCSRRQDKFLRLSSSKVDDFGDYDTTISEQLHSPASSLSSRLSRSPIPTAIGGNQRQGSQRPCSRSPLPNGGRSPKETPRIQRPAQNETELKQKIQVLEGTVAEYERQKFNVMGTFAEYRERVAERERKLEAEYSAKIITLSEEVLAAKKDFEERMKQFQALQEKFEREKEGALEKLRQEHQREIQLLEQRCSEHQLLNLEQKYMYEIQRLDEERKSLKMEKEKLTEAFDTKLWRAQTLYDTELNAAKSLYSNELEALKEHETALREELLGRQEEFKDRLDEMQLHLQQSKEELAKCEREVVELEKRLQEKEMEVQVISKQLEEARRETEEALDKLNGVENELETAKQKSQEQEEQLIRKADLLAALESTKNKLESVIQDLQAELKSLKSKVAFLENERQNLESQSQTQQQLQNSQLQALEMVLDNLSKEKQMMKEHYDQQLEHERVAAEQREFKLKKDYTMKLNDFERHHRVFQDQLEAKATEHREATVKRLETEFARRQKLLEDENERLQQELETVKKQLHSALPTDVKEFQVQVETLENKYKSTCERLAEEKKQNDSLRSELRNVNQQVESLSATVSKQEKLIKEPPACDFETRHKAEIEKLTLTIEQSVRERFEKTNDSIPQKTEEEYMKEIKILKSESASRARTEKLTVSELERSRIVVRNLQDSIEVLRNKLRQYEDSDGRRRSVTGSSKIDAENKLLQQELSSTKAELSRIMNSNAEKVNELLKKVDEQKTEIDQLHGNEQRLRAEIEKEMKQKYAQEAASSVSKTNHDSDKYLKKYKELQKELERKEKECEKLQEISKDSEQKDQGVDKVKTEMKLLKSELEKTRSDLEKKTQEILHIRNETHEYIRKREQQQMKTHKREVENLMNEHKAAVKAHEQAQERLKREMDEMQEKLKLMETHRQPSKDEIGDEVEKLRRQLVENEAAVRRLEEEKQSLKLALESGRDTQSQFSSPIGSMDNLKKRDSISSVSSARETGFLCRKANMQIINKWHCLVEQVKSDHKHRMTGTQKSSSASSIHKQRHFTQGAIEASAGQISPVSSGDGDAKSSGQKTPQQQGSQHDLSEATDDRSQALDDDSRIGRLVHRTSNTLRLPDFRRSTAKSPSRSPQPKPKHANASGRKPAWRL